MARLNPDNLRRAKELIGLYPEPRSALIPMLHIVQEQDGHLTGDGMEHVAELLELTPAEVYGTASFYDMFFMHPVGRYLVSVCTNLACMLLGGYELLAHAEERLGVASGATTSDGEFTLEEVECIAFCGEAPCLAVNWRFFGKVSNADFDRLVDDLRTGRLADRVPPHGTLNRVRRKVSAGGPAAGNGRPSGPPEEEGAPPGLTQPPGTDLGVRGEEEPAMPRSTASATQQARAIRVAGEGASEPDKGGADGDDDDDEGGKGS